MLGMDAGQPDPATDTALPDRNLLMSLAFRLLGSTHDAEDVVQETYARWYAMPESARTEITSPTAWLVKVAGRIGLDHLSSARVRRERYPGEWLPEPLPDSAVWTSVLPSRLAEDPADRVALDDSISMGMLVMLESLTPAQRVTFVLHDVFKVPFAEIATIVGRSTESCRALAVAARRGIGSTRRSEAHPLEYARVVKEFKRACRTGRLDCLAELLDPRVVSRADGGGRARAALRPIHGADRTARYLVGVFRRESHLAVTLENAGRRPALVCRADGVVRGVVSLHVVRGRITDVWLTLNPEKLASWP
ncbi:putative ECF RNA polymerase sigma factor SigI [Streptomyces sp. YIM 130001]|uniref:sigma-70 family RNA polymerase sigma factor n=1 Tax=Streptomyces sp. YIM 130001 TaxID=2259644 RepID=UPI000EE6D08A|nr:sigma-70 family RNA polymerase sigma factor [Streptomyces sp. YIM 130001]RII20500.1 putative ECF RNA polymerase sigma factor SigI [Streptomyces sp. YIM 130001]